MARKAKLPPVDEVALLDDLETALRQLRQLRSIVVSGSTVDEPAVVALQLLFMRLHVFEKAIEAGLSSDVAEIADKVTWDLHDTLPRLLVAVGRVLDVDANMILTDSELSENEATMQSPEWRQMWDTLRGVAMLNRSSSPASDIPLAYNMQGLKNIIGKGDNDTVRRYLKNAGLPVAKGKGNRMSYSEDDAVRFAHCVVASPTVKAHRMSAEKWLRCRPNVAPGKSTEAQ